MVIDEAVLRYGPIFILYAFSISIGQGLSVIYTASSYIKPRKYAVFLNTLLILMIAFHDLYWSLFGYVSRKNDIVSGVEMVLYCAGMYLFVKFFCKGDAFRNLCHLLAIEWWFLMINMVLTFPVVVYLYRFNMEETSTFLMDPTWQNEIWVIIIALISGLVTKKTWDFLYNHKRRRFYAFCFFFAICDISGQVFAGWRTACMIFPLMLYIVVAYLIQLNRSEKKLKEQFVYYQELAEVQKYKEKEISNIRHDLANHLTVMEEMKKESEGEALLKRIDKQTRNFTGIPVLDCLFREKQRVCREEDIVWEMEGIWPESPDMSEYELVSLFANLLDNAIEAARQTAEKKITLQVQKQQGFFKLVIRNTKLSDQKPVEDRFKTTKKDKKHHGIGNHIVRDIVESKGGRIVYKDEGNYMEVVVLVES